MLRRSVTRAVFLRNHRRAVLVLLALVLAAALSAPLTFAQTTPVPTPPRNTLLVIDAVVRGGPGESFLP
ncbi:MAG TPA: hypothetical protein PKX07_08730, partial [Aggregatilineales bacterium]|nr:hypothetical protein [Aggregatilineales bacterium]